MNNPVIGTDCATPPPSFLVFFQVAVAANRQERLKRIAYGIRDGLVIIRRRERKADV
jgi:hypothetical protein